MNDDTVAWKLQERAKIALLSSAVVHEWLGGSNAAREVKIIIAYGYARLPEMPPEVRISSKKLGWNRGQYWKEKKNSTTPNTRSK